MLVCKLWLLRGGRNYANIYSSDFSLGTNVQLLFLCCFFVYIPTVILQSSSSWKHTVAKTVGRNHKLCSPVVCFHHTFLYWRAQCLLLVLESMLLKVKTIAVCIHTLGYSSLFYDQFKEDQTSYVCTNVINGISTVFYFVFFLSSQKSSKLPSISRMLDRCTL